MRKNLTKQLEVLKNTIIELEDLTAELEDKVTENTTFEYLEIRKAIGDLEYYATELDQYIRYFFKGGV